ncbi:MAG: RNA polymerase sigma factor [Acidimicrobiales bacterium]
MPGDPGGSPLDELASERELVERARTDRAAFAELYRRHVNAVFAVAFRRGGSRDVAEEATAATFERALRSIGGFEWRDVGIRPWLVRIASNEVAEIHRRRQRGERVRDAVAHEAGVRADTDLGWPGAGADGRVAGVSLAELHHALSELPERYREVISLRYLAGLSADDAAVALGCTKQVLAVTLHRALERLRAELARPKGVAP